MKRSKLLLPVLLFITGSFGNSYSQICNPNGNLIIFSNYDGGDLNINVDVNIPNLKIGIISYESIDVTFSGAFVGNIVAVEWAGYDAGNANCTPAVTTTTISGVSPGIVTQSLYPPATYSDPDGYGSIICAYQCGAGNQGGCNTAVQIVDYFLSTLGGTLYFHYLQYNCWSGTQNISTGGNCCDQLAAAPVADFTWSPVGVCANDCVTFTDMSVNNPTSWSWTFAGGTPSTSTAQNPVVCFPTAGSHAVSLTATNANGSNTNNFNLAVNIADPSVSLAGSTLSALQSGATYQWIDCNNGNAAVSGATAQNFSPTVTGDYALVISSANCSDTSGCLFVDMGTGLEENNFDDYGTIYPNPTPGEIKFHIIDKSIIENSTVYVYNTLGKEIGSFQLNTAVIAFKFNEKTSGIYFMKLVTPKGTFTERIILLD